VKLRLSKVADGFENANGIVNAGDRRLFVLEQEGYVVLLKRRSNGTFRKAGNFLDIRSRVICCGEKGLLGLAFPPDYQRTGYFYVSFAGTGHTWNLEERRVSKDDPDRADPDYKRRSSGCTSRVTTTGAATSTSARMAISTCPSGMVASAAPSTTPVIPRTGRRTWASSSARSCASRRAGDARPARATASPSPTPSWADVAPSLRSGPTACAIRGAGRSTASPATWGSVLGMWRWKE